MANTFSNIKSGIEAHPVLASVIVGGVGLIATIYFMKRNSSQASTATSQQQNVCTDSNGNIVDCNTGLPIGTSGGFSLQPTNNNSDVLTAIGNLGQNIQNLIQAIGNNGGNNTTVPPVNPPGPPTPKPVTPPTPTPKPVNPPGPPTPKPVNPPKPPPKPVTPPPAKRYVTVAQWSATNTPWNSTLWGIAHHYGESLATIEKLNPQIKNPNLIYPKQKVYY